MLDASQWMIGAVSNSSSIQHQSSSVCNRLADNFRENVALTQNLQLFAVDFHLAAAVLAVDHFVADFDRELAAIAAIEELAGPSGENLAALGLFLGRVGKHDAASGHL